MSTENKQLPVVVEEDSDFPTTDTVNVGVYGTLKQGASRGGVLSAEGVRYLGIMNIHGIMFHEGGHPIVVQIPETIDWRRNSQVMCHVYNIPTRILRELDRIEAHPYYFKRKEFGDYQHGDVWVYVAAHPEVYLQGEQIMIPFNVWNGPSTKTVHIDFGDGSFKTKPKIDLKKHHVFAVDVNKYDNTTRVEGCIIDASTGEVEKVATDPTPTVDQGNPGHYKTKTWDQQLHAYVNENGQMLEWCNISAKHVLKGKAVKSHFYPGITPIPESKPPEGPSVIKVKSQNALNSPFPKIVNL
jgi:gamma-glutamylcyclotransferase (GGCT)/AIG2-like uncharacterized protein YtfP